MKKLRQLKNRIRAVYRGLCRKIAFYILEWLDEWTAEALSYYMDKEALYQERAIRFRKELRAHYKLIQQYRKLRILSKSIFSHGENVRYVGRTEVKIKLDKKLHDDTLKIIEEIENVEKKA